MGIPMIVITGSPDYYQRFGFKPASQYGIFHAELNPLEASPFFMVKILDQEKAAHLKGIHSDPDCYHISSQEADTFDARFPQKEKKVLPGQLR